MSNEEQPNLHGGLSEFHYFSTPVYISKQVSFLETVRKVMLASMDEIHGDGAMDELHPFRMSGDLREHPELEDFSRLIGQTAWDILSSQGYDMADFSTFFTEMWGQEHHYTSSMDYHVHPGGSHLVGFYFVDVPEDAPKAVVHDPRPARVMLELPQKDGTQATLSSTMINFSPVQGTIMIAPSWLPHSFSRNPSKEPFRFIHFNIGVAPVEIVPAEVV